MRLLLIGSNSEAVISTQLANDFDWIVHGGKQDLYLIFSSHEFFKQPFSKLSPSVKVR